MNLLGYLRVSTEEQVRNGNGLDIQRSQIESYSLAHNHMVVGWCADEGMTGTIHDRPGLAELYLALDSPDVDGVIAQADTRFGRSLEVQEAFFGRCWSLGKHVLTVQVGEIIEDDPDDPMRTMIRKFRGIVAEFEAGMIRQRLRAGKAVLHSKRLYKGGPVPFGWKVVGAEFRPVPEEQRVLKIISKMRRDKASSYTMVKMLNQMGIRAPKGGAWYINTIQRQLDYMQHPYDRKSRVKVEQRDNVSGDLAS